MARLVSHSSGISSLLKAPVAAGLLWWVGLQAGYALVSDAWLAEVLFPLGLAHPAAWLVAFCTDTSVRVSGPGLFGERAHLLVVRGCDGSDLLCALLAVVATSPVQWRCRLRAAVLGCLLVYALNLLRIAVLFWLAERRPSLFTSVHEWLAPTTLVGALGVLWWSWTLHHAPRCISSAVTTQGAQRPPASSASIDTSQGEGGCW